VWTIESPEKKGGGIILIKIENSSGRNIELTGVSMAYRPENRRFLNYTPKTRILINFVKRLI